MSGQGAGASLHAFASRLYPICRSITGNGVRQTLRIIGDRVPLDVCEVPTGTRVFDWEVPLEWNIEDACVEAPGGERVVDFQKQNLHLVGYSEPVDVQLSLADLQPRLHSLPEHPAWIPYRTSYYTRSWGFCLAEQARRSLRRGRYRVQIRSSLAPGALTYGEFALRGRSRDEVLFFTHVCHPSLANDNASGLAVATALAEWLAREPRRFSYRIVYAPGTIGSLCWLKANEQRLARIRCGLVLGLLGDSAPLSYKASRDASADVNSIAACAFGEADPDCRWLPFSPYGYDERQFCSPGFNLPVGRLTRSMNGGYPEYHSSADDLALIQPAKLAESLEACQAFVAVIEQDARYVNLSPKGEPRLGKRGLYGIMGGVSPAVREQAMLWLLNQSDGSRSLLDVARASGLPFAIIREAALALEAAGLLQQRPDARRTSRKLGSRTKRGRNGR
jgi:aminopeptidase-like protein